ncbi:MAG: hypothetical protein IT271_15225 [Chitinophagales bacterium]|nr:hypothetical protein [Chitinophagales bacterium]
MKKFNILFLILGCIQLFVALGALPVGYLFIIHPDGSVVGMNVEMLANSPFSDFLIPGIALFVFNGIFHLINAFFCFFKLSYAPYFGALLGIGLLIWMLVQVYSVGLNSYLQPVFFSIGMVELFLSLFLIKKPLNNWRLT